MSGRRRASVIGDTDHLDVEASKAMYLTIDRHAAPFGW